MNDNAPVIEIGALDDAAARAAIGIAGGPGCRALRSTRIASS
jgi:hypothetical protein